MLQRLSEENRKAQAWLDMNFTSAELLAMEHLQHKMLHKLTQLNTSQQKEASVHEKSDASTQAV